MTSNELKETNQLCFCNIFSRIKLKKKTIVYQLSILSIAIATLLSLWNHFAPQEYCLTEGFFIIIYFFASTLLFLNMTISANEKSPQHFVRAFIGTTAIRMFLGLIIILVYALIFRETTMRFALQFLLLYFIYLIFEVILLLKFLKK